MEMSDARLSNGRFAPKSRPAGRRKGTPDKTTRAVREFLAMLADDAEAQDAIRGRVIKGGTIAFFRAVDHVIGKPKENVDLEVTTSNDLIALLIEGRERSARAPCRHRRRR